jgi:hypothetical protein
MTALLVLLQLVFTVLTAELTAGSVHWLEDTYVREDTPVLGRFMARPNIVHHHYPRYFTKLSWWESSQELVVASAVIVLGAWLLGCLTWEVWLFAALSANANQIHKWTHQTRKENPRIVTFLQDIRVLQTVRHHAIHHTDPKSTHYCTITNVLNPVLEYIHFWAGLEWLVLKLTGIQRCEDTSVAGHGPGPEWLKAYRRTPQTT